MKTNERTIKVVLISLGSTRGYSYSAWRVVECAVGQKGYRNERRVKVIWQSGSLYRPTCESPRSKGFAAKQKAQLVAKQALAVALGI